MEFLHSLFKKRVNNLAYEERVGNMAHKEAYARMPEDKELLKKEIVQDSAVSRGLIKIIKDTQIE